jgi:Arc/MetJ-type ribon-helix-helix transcriptional regulator
MSDDVTTTLRVSRSLLARIDELARRDGGMRSRSESLRWALRRGVQALETDVQATENPHGRDLATELEQLRTRILALEQRQ